MCNSVKLVSVVVVALMQMSFVSSVCGKTSTTAVSRKDAFFGVHFDLHANTADTILGRDATPANIGAFLDRVKPDFVQYDCKGHPGYTGYPGTVGYAAPGINKDALALWRAETARRGVGLYVHYSGVWDSAAIAHNPAWARINSDGKPDPQAASLFSDYVDELMIPQLKEVSSRYSLDGVWVDGDCWGAGLDYGTTAALQWKDFSGTATLPRKSTDLNWQKWKGFHRTTFEKYLAHWVDALHEFNPDLELCSNWAYTPHMPIPVRVNVDFLSGDFSAKQSVDRARFEARYLSMTGMPWDLMAWGFNSYGQGGSPFQQKPAQQLMQEAAVVLALGGGMQVYYTPTRGGYVSKTVTNTAGAVADFCRERQTISHKSKSIPQIALVLSSTSYLRRMDSVYSPGGQYHALEGSLHALLESGYSVDLMSEFQLAPRINEFPVVVLAQAPAITKSFRAKLMDYVKQGGRLLLLDRESAASFQAELGVSFAGMPERVQAFVGDTSSTAAVPGLWQTVETSAAKALAFRTDAEGSFAEERSSDAYGYVQFPKQIAASSINIGKGKAIAVWGPAGQAFFDTHHPALRRWIGDLIDQVYPDPVVKLVDAPQIDISLRKLVDGRTALHLVNLNNAQRANRFAAIDAVPDGGPVQLVWNLERRPAAIKVWPSGESVAFSVEETANDDCRCVIEIPKIPIHSVVIPEYSSTELPERL